MSKPRNLSGVSLRSNGYRSVLGLLKSEIVRSPSIVPNFISSPLAK